jgi:uncharacterized protein (TIGR02646 family)
MRRFHKSTQVPAVLIQEGPKEKQKLIDAVDGGNDRPCFEESLYRDSVVKAQLKSDQNEKCAYCERKINGDYGAVEHYRPKGGWQQKDGDKLNQPGYYWLAYEWSNLLFSCDECNTSFKKNLFPLSDPSQRDITHRDISREQPLLINPSIEDPGLYIGFRSEMAVPRVVDDVESEKGKTTIELLGLNSRLALKQARRDAFFQYKRLKTFKQLAEKFGNQEALTLIDEALQYQIGENAEFTGMYMNQM